jgi:hypothetical protein
MRRVAGEYIGDCSSRIRTGSPGNVPGKADSCACGSAIHGEKRSGQTFGQRRVGDQWWEFCKLSPNSPIAVRFP